jgi:hypothetical protein
MCLETHTAQEYRHPVCVSFMHLTLKNTVELLEPALVDDYFITSFELGERFHKAIRSDSRSNETNDLLINRCRPVVETHHAMDAASKSYFVRQVVESKTRKYITREQRLDDTSQSTGELVALINEQPGTQNFQSPSLQVAAGALLLFRMSADHVPAKRVIGLI